jgi:hypothetical protein
MMCSMSDGIERPAQPNSDGEGSGVLANLPRTRPQRASPRRAAARRTEAEKADSAAAQARSRERSAPRGSAPSADPRATRGASEATTSKSAAAGPGAGRRASRNRPAKRASSTARRPRRSTPKLEPVPSQGYESDDPATGAVQPPGGAELLISAAEIVGELAKAGVSRSERLVKDLLSRLPLS